MGHVRRADMDVGDALALDDPLDAAIGNHDILKQLQPPDTTSI
jgi:hypothetical protein